MVKNGLKSPAYLSGWIKLTRACTALAQRVGEAAITAIGCEGVCS